MAGQENDNLVVLKPAAGAGRRPLPDPGPAADAAPPNAKAWVAAAAVASLGWLTLAHRYVATTLGWDAFGALRLHEQAQIAGGAAGPVAGRWRARGDALRGRELRDTIRALRRELQTLQADPATLDGRAATLAGALREQARLYAEAADRAAGRLDDSRVALGRDLGALTSSADLASARLGQVLSTLRRHADQLERSLAQFAIRSGEAEAALASQASLLAGASDKAEQRGRELAETLRRQV
ncbi:MAG: hypothetical protein ACK51F_21355 [Rhodospirillales bacterium]